MSLELKASLLSAGVSVSPSLEGNGLCVDVEAFSGSADCSVGAVGGSSVAMAYSALARASAAATDFLCLSTITFICASTCSIGRKYSSTSGSLRNSQLSERPKRDCGH